MRVDFRVIGAMMAAGLASGPSLGAKPRVAPAVAQAVIVNSGSTNTTGYRILVLESGLVRLTNLGRAGQPSQTEGGRLSASLTHKLFRDLAAAMPLSQLPAGHGFKSVSFGTSTHIEYKGQRTPDLSFPANAKARDLAGDATAVAGALHLKNGPRRPAQPLRPAPSPVGF